VFVVITGVRSDTLVGYLASEIGLVTQFRRGDRMLVLPDAVLDWTVVRPDGSEEGNLIGKLIDSVQLQLQQHPDASICSLLPPNKRVEVDEPGAREHL
jgi:hypothetical protein